MIRTPATLAFPLLLAAPGLAQVQVSVAPSHDNTLYESDTGALSNGAGSRVFAGTTLQGLIRRALLRFDVAAAVPPRATITAVELELQLVRTISGDHPATLHRVTQAWGEGPSMASGQEGDGAPAAPGDATWLHTFFPGTRWTSPGGDFVAQASGSTTIGSFNQGYVWQSTAAMVADAQAWLDDPRTNFGWIVLGDETSTATAKALSSREEVRPGFAPQLRITFTPPSAQAMPFGVGCSGSGSMPLALSANGAPTVPNPAFALALAGGPANAPEVVALALARLPVPFPIGQCWLYIAPETVLLVSGFGPGRTLPLPIPDDSGFWGARIVTQAFAVEGPTLLTSNGLTLDFGL